MAAREPDATAVTASAGSAAPILAVGSVALDAVRTPDELVVDTLGGSASYFALAAALFAPVRLVAVVGEDLAPEYPALFRERGVDLAGLQVEPGRTFRWSGQYSGLRLENRVTLDTQLNVFAGFHPVLPDGYRDSPIVFLGAIQPDLQVEVLEQARAARFSACDTIKLWLDQDHAGLERLYRRVDAVFLSDEEAIQFSGERFLPSAARFILGYGPRVVVIKRGENGAILFTREGMFVAPAMPLETVRDPTGAGDAFAGGFLGALARTRDYGEAGLRRAMLYGIVLGSLAVEDFSVRGIIAAGAGEVERRLSTLMRMISLDGESR